MNKKGDKIISVYWFAILFIVAAGVAYMAIAFYGSPLDVRELEADIMVNNIAHCLSPGTELREDAFSEQFANHFLEVCDFNFNVEDEYSWNDDQYYFSILFYDFNECSEGIPLWKDKTCKAFAGFEGGDKRWNNPSSGLESASRILYATQGEKEILVEIKAVVRKTEKNEA